MVPARTTSASVDQRKIPVKFDHARALETCGRTKAIDAAMVTPATR
jgi:hypothetical protein